MLNCSCSSQFKGLIVPETPPLVYFFPQPQAEPVTQDPVNPVEEAFLTV